MYLNENEYGYKQVLVEYRVCEQFLYTMHVSCNDIIGVEAKEHALLITCDSVSHSWYAMGILHAIRLAKIYKSY